MTATLCAFLVSTSALASPWWLRGTGASGDGFLPPDQAFRASAQVAGSEVRVDWEIADGYYLYRSRMRIEAASPDLEVGPLLLPAGEEVHDQYFGTQEIYRHRVVARASLRRSDFGAHPVEIKITYQGCAEAGLCYPPIVKVLFPDEAPVAPTKGPLPAASATAPLHPPTATDEWFAIGAGLVAFLLAGLLARRSRGSARIGS
ncbi:MAG: hypothetical protein KGL34_12245 [Gammaproteobacteria bacterium]|nr:hypothetical protein [Gammaproteobacteria bacterium]